MQINIEKGIYLLVFILLSSLLLVYANVGYPLFGGDSYSFLPTAIHLHNGDGLINKLYVPTGNPEVLFYPPLFPWVQNLFIFSDNANAIYFSLSITSISCLLVMAFVFYQSIITITKKADRILLFVLFMLALSTGIDISSGRPEILINLLLSLSLLVHVYKPKYSEFIYGVLLVLIGLTSPVTGVYCSFILLLYYLYHKVALQSYVKSALSASLVFVLFLMVYPYSFMEMLNTMISEANKIVFARDDTYTIKEFVKYHFLSPSYTFYFLLFFVSALVVFSKIYKSVFQILVFGLLLALIIYFGFRNLATNYYVYNLMVLYFFIVLSIIPSYKKIVMLMMLLCCIGFVRRAMLFTYFYDPQATITVAEEHLKNYTITNYKKNSSMWLFYYYQKSNVNTNDEYELHQQVYSAIDTYENIQNIEYNHSKFTSLKLAGITIANNPPFYYYKLSLNTK